MAFAVIQPNSPKGLRLDEMGYTDLGDSLEEMKIRAEHRHFNFPFLYDGETQDVSRLYGPVATPHVFVFDQQRKLRYEGRLDSNPREPYAKVPDARNAIDAVLAGKPVPVEKTPAVGCSVKWMYKETLQDAEMKAIEKEPVPLQLASPADLAALRKNSTGKTLLVNFWATWCGPCTAEFPELQKTWRMYRKRPFEMVTVSINYPDEEKGVRRFLDAQHASTRNLLFSIMDPYEEMKAFDPEVGRRRALHRGDRSGRAGGLPGAGRAGHSESAPSHPGQLPGRRLRRAKRLLESEVNSLRIGGAEA